MTIWHTKKLTTNKKKALQQKKRTYYRELGRKVDWVKRKNLQNRKKSSALSNGRSHFTLSTYKNSHNRKVWYLDKRAPIPGANRKLSLGYVRKNKRPKKAFSAYRMFKNYVQIRSKKRITKFFSSAYSAVACSATNRKNQMPVSNNREFSALIYFDSLYQSSLQKRAFKVKPGQKNMRTTFYLNGKYRNKKFNQLRSPRVRFQKGGDFSIVLESTNILRVSFSA